MVHNALIRLGRMGLLALLLAGCEPATRLTKPMPGVGGYDRARLVDHVSGKISLTPRAPSFQIAQSVQSAVENGGFEQNGGVNSRVLTGWTVVNAGDGSWFAQSGPNPPLSPFQVPPPPEGTFAAMVDQDASGSHILYQDVTIPAGGATLYFDLYLRNSADDYYTPNSLEHTFAGPNQQFRVDIMDPSAPIRDVGAGVLQMVYRTNPGDPLESGYTTISASLDQFAGQTIRLRFAEVDNQNFFNVGLDNVQIVGDAHQVTVTVNGPTAMGVVVTAKNVVTGEYLPALTNAARQVSFVLPDGSYLFHARNLTDLGPTFGGLPLVLAPLPQGSGLLGTTTEEVNQVGVLYDPSAPGNSAVLNPLNYSRLVADPPVELTGGSGDRSLTLQFRTGATVTCTLLDSDGSPVEVPSTENIFLIQPFRPDALIPPPPPEFPNPGLPPALLFSAARIEQGTNDCRLSGVPANEGYEALLETNPVVIDGQEKIFLQQIQITRQQATSGTVVPVRVIAEPRRAEIDYIAEPFRDARGTTDLGVVSYGWGVTNNQVNDMFTVGVRLRGRGVYSLSLIYNGTRARIDALCENGTCTLSRQTPGPSLLSVQVTGVFQGGSGTLIYQVRLPGVSQLDFRVFTGSPGADDYAPNTGLQRALRPTGLGNTWFVAF